MAPIHSRSLQYRQTTVLPPRPEKGPAGPAVPVDKTIPLKDFLLLFLGSFLIFVAAVYYWKVGAFFRSFSRYKVLSGGRDARIRYAKTWHGWVPLHTYEARLRKRRERFKRARKMMSWKTSHQSYSWLWWDPGGNNFHNCIHDPRLVRLFL